MEILSWDFSGDSLIKLESFERALSLYEASSSETVSSTMRSGIVMMRLPDGPLKQHLVMNAARLVDWVDFREEIVNIRRAQLTAHSTPTPMELGALSGGKGGDRKTCHVCGKPGHLAKDCWHAQSGGKKGGKKGDGKKGGGRGGPKGGSGRGHGGSNNAHPSAPQSPDKAKKKCYKCGKLGHYAAECRSKSMHALDDDQQEPERESPAASKGKDGDLDGLFEQDPTKVIGGLFLAALDDEYESMDRDLLAMEEPRNISFTVDSGAVATVIPENCFTDYPKEPNAQSKAGVHYRSCTGERVRDQGTRRLIGRFKQNGELGDVRGMKARVVKVNKALAAVSEMVDLGHTVTFSSKRSYAKHDVTGQEVNFERVGGTWKLDMQVAHFDDVGDVLASVRTEPVKKLIVDPASPFGRRGFFP